MICFNPFPVVRADFRRNLLLVWVTVLLVALSVVLFLYVVVMIRRGGTAKESAGCLLTREAWLFGGAGCALGLGIPMAIAVGVAGAGSVAGLLVLAAVARLCGDFAIRYAVLRAGMFSPLV